MNYTIFNAQGTSEQFDTILAWGFMMMKMNEGTETKVVFALNDFFAEVVINKINNQVLAINSFRIEDFPIDYYMMIDHDNPFVTAALANSEILSGLCIAA